MNVGFYTGAAGMRVSQDYQEMISENLSLQSIPGYKQSMPVFSTDLAAAGSTQATPSGNPAAVSMTRVIDFSQGELQSTGNPYNVAIEGKAFFKIREADGSTSYSRNGAFELTKRGELATSDGATVLSKGGSAVHLDTSKGGILSIGKDGSLSMNGVSQGALGLAHFDNPSASLQQGAYGRFIAPKSSDAKDGLDKNDLIVQGSLEQGNANPVTQMADMIQAVRLYEVNSKSVQAIDDNQNQLITSLGSHAQA